VNDTIKKEYIDTINKVHIGIVIRGIHFVEDSAHSHACHMSIL
jgi:hypothetical protein